MSKRDFSKPHQVDDVTLAFPAGVVGTLLPDWEEIPEQFKSHSGNKWNKLFNDWFFSGLKSADGFKFKEGVDRASAFRHIKACMGSFQPKHEHKEAGVAYLYSLWLEEDSTWERAK